MIDRYSKTVLTIIALCLATIVLQNHITPANAQNGGQVHVVVDQIGFSPASLPLAVHAQ